MTVFNYGEFIPPGATAPLKQTFFAFTLERGETLVPRIVYGYALAVVRHVALSRIVRYF